MHKVIILAIIINILTVLAFATGLFHNFQQPKNKALYGYFIAGCVLMYMVTISIAAIYLLLKSQNLYGLILFLCVLSPFIVGKLVKYETLKKYTVIQIICFIASLIILLFNY